MSLSNRLDRFVVTAAQMQAIEQSVFAAGMPVAALMEKVGGLLFARIQQDFPQAEYPAVGLLVGPGHNGGDALVVGRELLLAGREVVVWMPTEQVKELTAAYARYLRSLGASWATTYAELQNCQVLIDGLFGFGLGRSLEGVWAATVKWANQSGLPIASIDVPSGIETDRGEVLGTAIRAHMTYCLGLWKQGLLQDRALDYTGNIKLVDFGLPLSNITAALGQPPLVERLTVAWVRDRLPDKRWGTGLHPPNPNTHKYSHGHLLLVCGSIRYSGAAILTALGARPSGVGMVTVAVPEDMAMLVRQWVPEGLVLPCPQTASGSIAAIPGLSASGLENGNYTAIALGPGMDANIDEVLTSVCSTNLPLLLDADGLNVLARASIELVVKRIAPTILTPHVGEFRRLFPTISPDHRFPAVQTAARHSQSVVLLKGARTVISDGARIWVNPDSTPALARGGSGDVLTGLVGGLLAQGVPAVDAAAIGTWWHAKAAISLAQESGVGAVDPVHLANRCRSISPVDLEGLH
ncbi:MAG: NAD(P)H-hydrate dehydratase [Cyanobacteria bacterium J06597_1]